jgi:hypothetical protein
MKSDYKGIIFSTKYLYKQLEGDSVLNKSGCNGGVISIYLFIHIFIYLFVVYFTTHSVPQAVYH